MLRKMRRSSPICASSISGVHRKLGGRSVVHSVLSFLKNKSGAMTMEYITIAAIGTVVAIAVMYQIGGGDDGSQGMTGLVNALSGELGTATTNIEGSVAGASGNGS